MLPILFISVSIKSKFCPAIFFNTALFFYASCQRKENISFSSHEGSSFFSLMVTFYLFFSCLWEFGLGWVTVAVVSLLSPLRHFM